MREERRGGRSIGGLLLIKTMTGRRTEGDLREKISLAKTKVSKKTSACQVIYSSLSLFSQCFSLFDVCSWETTSK